MSLGVKILVVDDEQGMRDMLVFELSKRGYGVVAAADGRQALRRLESEPFQLVISDVKMPEMTGLEMLVAIKRINPDMEVILATGFGTIETAVSAMKHGAYDFIQKPFFVDELLALVARALERKELKAAVALYEASRALFQTLDLDVLIPKITELARAVLRADEIAVLLDKDGALEGSAPGLCCEESRRLCQSSLASPEPVSLSDRAALACPLLVNGERVGVLWARRNGSPVAFNAAELRSAAIFGAQIAQAVYNARTFERLRKTQEDLIHSERIGAVGRLAASVAHELNNPLTSVLGAAQLMLQENGLLPQQREDLECIVEHCRRCRVITQGLLQLGRKSESRKEALSIESLLDSVLRLAKFELASKKVEVRRAGRADEVKILADQPQMQQVFLNLITNAGHAMEERPVRRLEIDVKTSGGRVMVGFRDTGCGIPPENLSKIFDPFFTTKPVDKGTGLGLSVCREIIARHGGEIQASSSPEGAVFTVGLPAL